MDKIIEKLKNLKQHHIIKYMENLSSEEYANRSQCPSDLHIIVVPSTTT